MDEPLQNCPHFKELPASGPCRAGSHSGVKQGAASTPKPQADTHIGSLGALGSWKSFGTRVALKCKSSAQGDAAGQGEQPTGAGGVGDPPDGLGGGLGAQNPPVIVVYSFLN